MVVSVRKLSEFQSCKPSAHYQLPLVSGCPGHCQYCYLSTNLGKDPYVRVYVNVEEILAKTDEYIKQNQPEKTIFEGAATSDPLPVEPWTGSLARAIKFFSQQEYGRFRFVTKFTVVDPLLNINHNGNTEFRFSLNSRYPITKFEKGTPSLDKRLKAAVKVIKAGYKTGFLIAPIFIYDNWQLEYRELIKLIAATTGADADIFLELITHRFTSRAKEIISNAYPDNKLPMIEDERKFKYGQFGYGKYVYPPAKMQEIEDFMQEIISRYLPRAEIKYFV